ncbi:pilus assembly protein [Roseateles sp. DAIF2]|uniref:TadE/TadG family type IV pilus assembly protein n=1 Tax=Roseateles sp. DAIF2 TaxID=2714952 RepID=UPI0018A2850F|nr:TadE family protein [Roseateles sp. DAIF2]QPF73554.1 pilus assembly protein [Roseateles sp. DAIF2]
MTRKHRPIAPLRRRGVAAVELGILMIPLLLLVFGSSELGRAVFSYNVLDKTVRDAARHLSQHGPGDATIAGEARCLAVYGNSDCSGSAVAPGLTTAMVTICDASLCPGSHANQLTGLGAVNLVTASVEGYTYNSIVKFVVPSMNFNRISVTMRAQL